MNAVKTTLKIENSADRTERLCVKSHCKESAQDVRLICEPKDKSIDTPRRGDNKKDWK